MFMAITACIALIIAKPLENDGAEIVMKIEKLNEQLPGNVRRLAEYRAL